MTTLEITMMVAFMLALGLSLWKLYAFMPNKPLADDDTNKNATQELKEIMYDVIHAGSLDEEDILEQMKAHPRFDAEHFWRFNHNRLKQLLQSHFIEHPHHSKIEDIHQDLNKREDKS